MTKEEERKLWLQLTKQSMKYEAYVFKEMRRYFRKVSDKIFILIDDGGDEIERIVLDDAFDPALLLASYLLIYNYIGKDSFLKSYASLKLELGSTTPSNFANALWLQKLNEITRGVEIQKRIQSVIETTRNHVNKILVEGKKQNMPIAKLKRFIRRNLLSDYSRNRSKTISRVETQFIQGEAELESAKYVAQELGIVLEKRWIRTFDSTLRDTHRYVTLDYINISEKFNVGGYLAMRPGDPSLPLNSLVNCRCKLHYRKKDGGFI